MKTKVTIAAISVCGLGSCLVFYFVLSQSSKPENKGSRSGHTQQSKTDGKPSSQSTGGGKGNPGITNPNTRVGSILSDPRNANLAELDWEGSSEAKALFENGWTLLQAQGYKDARQLFEKIYADAPDTELGKLAYWSVAFCMYGDGRNEVGCADAAERFKRSSNLLDSDSKLQTLLETNLLNQAVIHAQLLGMTENRLAKMIEGEQVIKTLKLFLIQSPNAPEAVWATRTLKETEEFLAELRK